MEYRRKPNIVELFRMTRDAEVVGPAWFLPGIVKGTIDIDRCIRGGAVQVYGCTIATTAGQKTAKIRDYKIRGPESGLNACLEIDKGGSDNVLFGNTTTGQGTSGFNSLLLKVEKYDGEPLVPDVEKPLRIVFYRGGKIMGKLPFLPSSDQTNPSLRIRPKEWALSESYRKKEV